MSCVLTTAGVVRVPNAAVFRTPTTFPNAATARIAAMVMTADCLSDQRAALKRRGLTKRTSWVKQEPSLDAPALRRRLPTPGRLRLQPRYQAALLLPGTGERLNSETACYGCRPHRFLSSILPTIQQSWCQCSSGLTLCGRCLDFYRSITDK